MDWRKAKNYIIALLLVLNLILLFSIFGHNNNASIDNPYFSQSTLEDLEQLLALHQVEVAVDIPRTLYNLGTMNVEYQNMDQENFPKLYANFDEILTLENTKKNPSVYPKNGFTACLGYQSQHRGWSKAICTKFFDGIFSRLRVLSQTNQGLLLGV